LKPVVLDEYGGPEKLKFEDYAPQPQMRGDMVLFASAASGVRRANCKALQAGQSILPFSNQTYAELVAVDDSELTHQPDGVEQSDAAAIPSVSLTADQLVRHAANVQ
jgi:NADPH:quinone reductase-like Zn-dependent oxidoreductase